MIQLTDTILAPSSGPAAPGALRAILRLSGPAAWPLSRLISDLPASATRGHHPVHISLPALPPIPAAIMLFQAPHSFTGQDMAELHLPASPALVRLVTDHLLHLAATHKWDARPANPGEFSARAFFNQKLDLTQAEGLAATINASTRQELRAAASLRNGDLHGQIARTTEELANLLALLEAEIDFTEEEDVHFISDKELFLKLITLSIDIKKRLARSVHVDRLGQSPTVVFVGKPNVGKSSLINALSRQDRSIISPVAGTTRDALTVTMATESGLEIRLVDVPGEEVPSDELRRKMMKTHKDALLDADLVVEVVAGDLLVEAHLVDGLLAEVAYSVPAIVVQNKIDLVPTKELIKDKLTPRGCTWMHFAEWQLVSAVTGKNLDLLRSKLIEKVNRNQPVSSHQLILNHRHRTLLREVAEAVGKAAVHADLGFARSRPELLAAELRHALDLLGQITGTISPDDVLGRIFSRFCIGK